MNISNIFLPVIIQISLTLIMFILLGKRKIAAIKSGKVDRNKTALDNKAWPEDVVKVSNNIANQFQTPVLFYILCVFFYLTNTVTTFILVLSWIFVITRFAHGYVHVTSNFVPARFSIFIISVLALLVMTVMAFLSL